MAPNFSLSLRHHAYTCPPNVVVKAQIDMTASEQTLRASYGQICTRSKTSERQLFQAFTRDVLYHICRQLLKICKSNNQKNVLSKIQNGGKLIQMQMGLVHVDKFVWNFVSDGLKFADQNAKFVVVAPPSGQTTPNLTVQQREADQMNGSQCYYSAIY